MAAVGVFLGGGAPGTDTTVPPIGTAEARPTLWLGAPELAQSSLPNVLVVSVMAHESGGQVLAQNYNCSDGTSAAEPCEQVDGSSTRSEDAGLMQINSGGWPVPQDAAKWQALGMAGDPFDPTRNLAAGVSQLAAEVRQYRYVEYALEAYNSGSGGANSGDVAYSEAVQSYIGAYEQGPTISAWSTADWLSGQWKVRAHQQVWLVVAAAGPYGASYSVPWAPGKPTCKTTFDPTTRTEQTTCSKHDDMLTGKDLKLPSSVTPNGQPMALSPSDAPIWPGESAYALQVTGPGTYSILATWRGGHTATTTITLAKE